MPLSFCRFSRALPTRRNLAPAQSNPRGSSHVGIDHRPRGVQRAPVPAGELVQGPPAPAQPRPPRPPRPPPRTGTRTSGMVALHSAFASARLRTAPSAPPSPWPSWCAARAGSRSSRRAHRFCGLQQSLFSLLFQDVLLVLTDKKFFIVASRQKGASPAPRASTGTSFPRPG